MGSALLASGAAALIGQVPASAASWVPTGTKALPLKNATLLGAASATTPLRLTVGLAPRNRAALAALIKAQETPGNAAYEKFLTPAQFTAAFAATSTTATQVSKYLSSQGLTNITIAANRLQITANATVAQAEKAFDTKIASYRQAGKTVLANTTAALVPASLSGEVSGVLGLSTLGASATPSVTVPKLTGYYPKEFDKVYDTGSTSPGSGTTLAVIAEGDLTSTVKDLRTAESKQGLPQVPVSLVYSGVKSPDTAGADEWDLDTQTSTGVAPNAKRLYIYVATSLTDSDLARAVNLFVSQNVAKSGSASLGECDALPYLDGSMAIDDIAFAEAAVQGQTFFASTGDTGSSCAVAPTNGVPGAGLPDTEYPASSPYVVAVGGTTLDTDDNDVYQAEVAWNSGGGGASPVETGGYWQSGVVPTSAAGLRGLPDVAFDADPNTGAQIYVGGAPEQIGGTSLSSPLALGLWTRLQASHGGKLGFASPKLYALYTKAQGTSTLPPTSVPGFHDVVVGSNGAYTALPGYDYTTGLGSWDVAALSKAIK
ncbi:protease pro-enzyme activation domain-containing protein [uncultured Jatrophihabitans sp.]|uniref:S53 family peptidase n=1 Tax=uncultured Jatrophihabitans sp. TaxID=1610747 RepID=UPI0035C9BBC6